MAKRNFAALALLAVLVTSTPSAFAEKLSYSVDGCAKLARVVYSEVANAALYGPGNGGPWVVEQNIGVPEQCDHVASTVSRAFASALRSTGVSVRFPSGSGSSGDACLSGFLSQCYPNRDPLRMGYDSFGYNVGASFAGKSWFAVSQSVMRQMHNPYSSDQIQFREHELRLRLGLALRSASARPQH